MKMIRTNKMGKAPRYEFTIKNLVVFDILRT